MALKQLAASLLMLVAACGTPSSTVVGPMVIGDSDPVRFAGRQPTSYPVRGMDAARFQTSVDWPRAKAVGIEFVFLKATEGGDLEDPKFRDHWKGAGRAGIARGAYHFYYFCTDPATQARFFISKVPRTRGSLPPVLDMEWNPFSPTCQRRPDGATVRAEMKVWLDMVEDHYGQRPIIYTTPRFYKENGLSTIKREEFWLIQRQSPPVRPIPASLGAFGNTQRQEPCRAHQVLSISMHLMAALRTGQHGAPVAQYSDLTINSDPGVFGIIGAVLCDLTIPQLI